MHKDNSAKTWTFHNRKLSAFFILQPSRTKTFAQEQRRHTESQKQHYDEVHTSGAGVCTEGIGNGGR